MNILIITNHFRPENFRINDLADGLVEKGHNISVMTSIPNYPQGRYHEGYGLFKNRKERSESIQINRVPVVPRGNGSAIKMLLYYLSSCLSFSLSALLEKNKHDVVFVFGTSPLTIGIPAALIKMKHKTPVVFWVLDLWPESLQAAGGVNNRFVLSAVQSVMNFLYRRCTCVLVSCKGFSDSIASVVDRENTTVRYFPNWVEPQLASGSLDFAKLPKLPEGFCIVFTGNVGEAQDWEKIIESAISLKEFTDIHWVIVGDGRRVEWLKSQVSEHELDENFHLLGSYPLEAMAHFYKQADCLLVSLRDEEIFSLTVPGKLQSYMDSGKPVVAAIAGEGASIVQESECGLVCRKNNSTGLRSVVLELYGMSEGERQQLGGNGKEYSDNHYNRTTLFNDLESVLFQSLTGSVVDK